MHMKSNNIKSDTQGGQTVRPDHDHNPVVRVGFGKKNIDYFQMEFIFSGIHKDI